MSINKDSHPDINNGINYIKSIEKQFKNNKMGKIVLSMGSFSKPNELTLMKFN